MHAAVRVFMSTKVSNHHNISGIACEISCAFLEASAKFPT